MKSLKQRFDLERRQHKTILKDGEPYLTRWWLTSKTEERHQARKRLPGVLLHHIHREDGDRYPHNHPWWFVSLVLKGSYKESRYNSDGTLKKVTTRRRFTVALRTRRCFHDVSWVSDDLWTVILCGPKKQNWGFVVDGEFMHHSQYIDEGTVVVSQ